MNGLNQAQRDAVGRREQDVCVVAGPGSGKTRVLVERFRQRVAEGVSPLRLLAVTFTEKAANELKQRLARHFQANHRLRQQIERAPVHTIDGFCARLLHEHAIEAGLDPQFDVLEPADAFAELYSAAEEALDELFHQNAGGVRALLTALDLSDPVTSLLQVYQAMRITVPGVRRGPTERTEAAAAAFDELLDSLRTIAAASPAGWTRSQAEALGDVQEWARHMLALGGAPVSLDHFRLLGEGTWKLTRFRRNNSTYDEIKRMRDELRPKAHQALVAEYYAPQRALLFELLDRLDRGYRERKQALNALDFADLEEFAIRLLREDARLRERVRDSFDEILMDELQDTNPLQATLMDLARRPDRFFAVGDVNQSIYGFRYANPEVFKRYRDELRAQGRPVDQLRENYRSRPDILEAARRILGHAEGIEGQPLEAVRPFPEKAEPSVEVIAAFAASTEEAVELEARLVAARMLELQGRLAIQEKDTGLVRPAELSDMVVLVRNVNALPPLEHALHAAGIPYLVARGRRFYEAQEVNDLVHLLRAIANAHDEVSLAVVLRSPLVSLTNEAIMRLKLQGNLGAALLSIHDGAAGFDPGDLQRLRAFRDLFQRLRAEADDVAPDRLLLRAMDAAGYEATLNPRARANVRKLLARVRDWHDRHPGPLARLVEELAFLRASDPDEPTAPPGDSSNAVRLMTIHGAKGLEFPVVFVAALHKGVARESPVLSFSPAAGLVARWLDPVSGEPVKDLPYTIFFEEQRRKDREESNRLLYVAMTRAEEHLVLSFARTERGPRNWADAVSSGLGLELGVPQDRPVLHQVAGEPPLGVRVWFTAAAPAPACAAEPARGEAREPELVERPGVSGQHDASVSVTSISLFEDCPRRYYLARYLGWQDRPAAAFTREPEDDSVDAGELGVQVHELLAQARVPDALPLALELAGRFQASELGRRAAAASRVEREFDFLVAVDEMLIHGRIDLWFEEGLELVLVDYKTDDVDAAGAAERAAEYAPQLQLYALALERFAGRLPGRALLYFLRPDAVIPVALDAAALAAARAAIGRLRQAQERLDFPLRPAPRCRRCGFYRGLCPAV